MIRTKKGTVILTEYEKGREEEKAKALKAPVEILIVKNSGHNWRKVDAEIEPSREEIIRHRLMPSLLAILWIMKWVPSKQ